MEANIALHEFYYLYLRCSEYLFGNKLNAIVDLCLLMSVVSVQWILNALCI